MELKTIGKSVYDATRTVGAYCAVGMVAISAYTMAASITAFGALTDYTGEGIEAARKITFHPIETLKDLMKKDEAE